MTTVQEAVVRKSVVVNTSMERAFAVFTDGFDTWWPRSHHIGKSPMTKALIEGKAGGRCYAEQEDGNECDWGRVQVWDPPRRVVIAWQIDLKWQYDPDLTRASEVEIRFSAEPDGQTRVDLVHRNFERHGEGWETIRASVDSEGGWGALLALFKAKAEN